MTPFKALNWLTKYAISSEYKGANYLFFETLDGYKLQGDKTAEKYFVGEKYSFEYQFSQQYLQLKEGQSRTAVKEGRLQIRNWSVTYDSTGHFKVEITPKARDTVTEIFNGTVVGSGSINVVNLEDGDYTFAVQSRNEGLVVKLTSDEYLPCHFINAEWQGYYNQTSSN